MIQRSQSIWLLLAAIVLISLLFTPIFKINQNSSLYTLYGTGIEEFSVGKTISNTNFALLISIVLASSISLINIFNFKNRPLQRRIASINILLVLALSFWIANIGKTLPGGLEKADIGAGLFFPLIAIIFSLLAIRGIKRDEQLVKSADRLR